MIESMPQEIAVRYILPSIRREFARVLVEDKKFSQKEAAKLLDITEAAVSQYINSKRAKQVVFSEDVVNEIKKAVNRLIADYSKQNLIKELYNISNLTKVKQILCDIHRLQSKELSTCNVCFEEKNEKSIMLKVGNK